MPVIEELDTFKTRTDEVGVNARHVIRTIKHYIEETPELLGGSGVVLEEGTRLRAMCAHPVPEQMPQITQQCKDNQILAECWSMQQYAPEHEEVILVTRDVNMRIKALTLGLKTCDYECGPDVCSYLGHFSAVAGRAWIDAFALNGCAAAEEGWEGQYSPNDYIVVQALDWHNQQILARYTGGRDGVVVVGNHEPYGIKAKNLEQTLALDALMNPDIPLVTLTGTAGTGKTLLALAAGLAQTTDTGVYRKTLVSRPMVSLGNDIGFMPGDKHEKLQPWLQPIFDNLDVIINMKDTCADDGVVVKSKRGYPGTSPKKKNPCEVQGHGGTRSASRTRTTGPQPLYSSAAMYLMEMGFLDVEAMTFMRGRSLPNQYILVDEAQNLTPLEVKTLISRAGEGAKIVLTGDPEQIDAQHLDSESNGLIYAMRKLRHSPLSAHVHLTKGERSELADLAAKCL
jgi:PhoH-like ATPase